MEAPLIAVEEPALAPSAAAPAARFALTPARLVGAALALAALAAVSLALPLHAASSGAKADQDDEETHAPNALAPVKYRSAAEVAAAVPGAIVGGANPLVLCVVPRAAVFSPPAPVWDWGLALAPLSHVRMHCTAHTHSTALAWATGAAAAAPLPTPSRAPRAARCSAAWCRRWRRGLPRSRPPTPASLLCPLGACLRRGCASQQPFPP